MCSCVTIMGSISDHYTSGRRVRAFALTSLRRGESLGYQLARIAVMPEAQRFFVAGSEFGVAVKDALSLLLRGINNGSLSILAIERSDPLNDCFDAGAN
jgi:hypothetical protein